MKKIKEEQLSIQRWENEGGEIPSLAVKPLQSEPKGDSAQKKLVSQGQSKKPAPAAKKNSKKSP